MYTHIYYAELGVTKYQITVGIIIYHVIRIKI